MTFPPHRTRGWWQEVEAAPQPLGLNCRTDTGPTDARRLTDTMRGRGIAVEHAYPQRVLRVNPQQGISPVRFSPRAVIAGNNVAVAAAYVALVVAVVVNSLLPVPALLMLLTIPLALKVSRGLAPYYDNPYGLMAIMGTNVQLHLRAGLLLLAGYAIVLIVGAIAPSVPLFLGWAGQNPGICAVSVALAGQVAVERLLRRTKRSAQSGKS